MINAKIVGMLLAAFVAGSFISSPELRAYAANTIRSGDIVDGEVKNADLGTNAVTTSKINDGAVKKADIATDAVDGEEIMGVTQLTFAECLSPSSSLSGHSQGQFSMGQFKCVVNEADVGENVIATNNGNRCFVVNGAFVTALNEVTVGISNLCDTSQALGPLTVSIILFDVD